MVLIVLIAEQNAEQNAERPCEDWAQLEQEIAESRVHLEQHELQMFQVTPKQKPCEAPRAPASRHSRVWRRIFVSWTPSEYLVSAGRP